MNAWNMLIQAIGYIGLIFAIIAFQCKIHKKVMIYRTLNEMFFAVQYFLLGSYTGVIMNLVGSVRNLTFAKYVETGKSTKALQVLFCIAFVVLGISTSKGLVSIMVILAKIITTIAYSMKNTTYVRLLTLPTNICWLVYNIVYSSSAGILCELFTISSIVTAIIRLDIPRKSFSLGRSFKINSSNSLKILQGDMHYENFY